MTYTISLCMIVKNEEKVLEKCLNSVQSKVDEIIIVDTGSTDRTLEIAEKYQAKIYSFEWINDFAAARNYSLDQATSDYLLVLDADEYLEEQSDLKKDIAEFKDYYIMRIKNLLSNNRVLTHSSIRVFKNEKRLRYKNRLHEHLDIDQLENELSRGEAEAIVQHTGYTDEIMEEKDKRNRNMPLMQIEVKENPTSYNLYNMAKLYMNIEEYDKAFEYFKKAFVGSENRMYQPELLTKMASCLDQLGFIEDGLKVLEDAVELYPEDTGIWNERGNLFKKAGYYRDAELAWLHCLAIGDNGITVNEGVGSYIAYFNLAILYDMQGKLLKSYEMIVQSIQTNIAFVPSLNKYFEIVLKANIPLGDIYNNFNLLYNVASVEELQRLLDLLYTLRHPLLHQYIENKNIVAEKHVAAISYQYIKQYDLAQKYWGEVEEVAEENAIDLLTLAFIKKDIELLIRAKSIINVSEKEYKIIKLLFDNQSTESQKLSANIKNILIDIFDKLIYLQEFDVLQTMANLLSETNSEFQYRFGKLLAEKGYSEAAIDVLIKAYNQNEGNTDINILLGDLCISSGYLEDAQLFYNKLIKLKPEYSSYERCYNIAEKMNDVPKMVEMQSIIKEKYPLSKWITTV
ncbi:glycosyltransferase [Paenibacillus kyungheensis]